MIKFSIVLYSIILLNISHASHLDGYRVSKAQYRIQLQAYIKPLAHKVYQQNNKPSMLQLITYHTYMPISFEAEYLYHFFNTNAKEALRHFIPKTIKNLCNNITEYHFVAQMGRIDLNDNVNNQLLLRPHYWTWPNATKDNYNQATAIQAIVVVDTNENILLNGNYEIELHPDNDHTTIASPDNMAITEKDNCFLWSFVKCGARSIVTLTHLNNDDEDVSTRRNKVPFKFQGQLQQLGYFDPCGCLN